MTGSTANKWTCTGCGVAASSSDAEQVPLPDVWETCTDGIFCLGCRRQRAAQAAVDSAPETADRDARARLRRTGLIEFEVSRAPDRPNGAIAKACRSSIAAVTAARQRLNQHA